MGDVALLSGQHRNRPDMQVLGSVDPSHLTNSLQISDAGAISVPKEQVTGAMEIGAGMLGRIQRQLAWN